MFDAPVTKFTCSLKYRLSQFVYVIIFSRQGVNTGVDGCIFIRTIFGIVLQQYISTTYSPCNTLITYHHHSQPEVSSETTIPAYRHTRRQHKQVIMQLGRCIYVVTPR